MKSLNLNSLTKRDGFDTILPSRPVGDWIKCAKGHWSRDGRNVNPDERYAVIMPTWQDGAVLWEDQQIVDLQADYVVNVGRTDRSQTPTIIILA